MKVNGSHSRDKLKEQVDPLATNKTSKLAQQSDAQKSQRPSSINKSDQNLVKKDSYDRNAPPVPMPPKQKVREQDLMTESRIMEARNGLQLLKKKMSQRGMSRGKIQVEQAEVREEALPPKTGNIPPARRPSREEQEQPQPPSQKAIRKPPTDKPKPVQKQPPPPADDYSNPNEQIAIQPKQVDFERMIEQQLRKEMKGGSKPIQKYSQPKEYDDGGDLVECSAGCGRKFNEQVVEKHEKVCRKVFQEKRKVFDSSEHRKVEAEGEIPQYTEKVVKKQSKAQPQAASRQPQRQPQEKKAEEVPKWKLQSAAFRAGLKRAGGRQLTKQQQDVQAQQKNLLTLCNFCGRRFNTKAAERHIPFCQEKSRKIPAARTTTTSMNSTFQGKKKK